MNRSEISIEHPMLAKRFFIWSAVFVLAAYAGFACFQLGLPDLSQDEGAFGLSAVNILRDYRQVARVAERPEGPAATKPFLFPVALAMSVEVLGRNPFALRIVNVVALVFAAFFLYIFLRDLLKDRVVAFLASAAFLLNPGTIRYARSVTAEPFLLLWGSVALLTMWKFVEELKWRWAILCGASLGLGFLSKLWLIGSFALLCFVVLLISFINQSNIKLIKGCFIAGAAFLVFSTAHLLLVLWLTPSDIRHWINIYFGVSLGTRVAGHGYDPVLWFRPWWFYLAAVFKATFFAFPPMLLGLRSVFSKHSNLVLRAVVCILLLPVLLLSLFHVKEAVYMFSVFPGLMLLIGIGCKLFVEGPKPRELVIACVSSMIVAVPFLTLGVVSRSQFVGVEILYLLFVAPALLRRGASTLIKAALVTSVAAMLLADVLVVRQAMEHRTYYREIASYFASQLSAEPPARVVFTGPEFASFAFSMFHNGEYWKTYYYHKDYSEFRRELETGAEAFYVIDPSGHLYGGTPSPQQLLDLREYALEITPLVEKSIGHKLTIQIHVPKARRELLSQLKVGAN